MAIILNPLIGKNGLAHFVATSATPAANGKYPLQAITAKSGDATIKVNGNSIQQGAAVWDNVNSYLAFITYQLQCGSVTAIPMSNGGTASYTSPSASVDATSASKGLTVGTPVTSTGVLSFAVTNGGSGYSTTFFAAVPGGTYFKQAQAQFNVSGGAVTSIQIWTGSWFSHGLNYTGNFSGSINAAGGTGCTYNATVGNYIYKVPVLTPGTGLLVPPTITITDGGSGAGAVAAPIMSGPASTDTVTYSAPANWFTTAAGNGVLATNASMFNYVSQLEGPANSLQGFRISDTQPTMKLGGEYPGISIDHTSSTCFAAKDRMMTCQQWQGSGVTFDSLFNPASWTPGGTITSLFYMNSIGLLGFVGSGTWTILYHDAFYRGATTATTTMTLSSIGAYTVSASSSWTTTIVGDLVKIQIPITYSGISGSFQDPHLQINWTSSDGANHVTHPANSSVFRPMVMAPGNTFSSNYFDADDVAIAALTGPKGTTPAEIRFMDSIGGGGGLNNFVRPADKMPVNLSSWDQSVLTAPTNGAPAFQYARFFNTNPAKSSTGDNTYPWPASTKLYNSQNWIATGTDTFGNYALFGDSPNGANDNGAFLVPSLNPNTYGLIELRSTSPHGIAPFQIVQPFPSGGATITIPWTNHGTVSTFGAVNLNAVVTGPNTIVIIWPFFSAAGSGPDTVNSTSEITLPVVVFAVNKNPISSVVPTEFAASFVSRLPGSNLYWNCALRGCNDHNRTTGLHYNDGYICGTLLGPTNGVDLEGCNEPWNTNNVSENYFLQSLPQMAAYAPNGASMFGGYYTGTNAAMANGYIVANTFASAQAFDSFVAGWVAAGRSPSQINRYYSSAWGQSGLTNAVVFGIQHEGAKVLPAQGVTLAPYQGMGLPDTLSSTIYNALYPPGLSGGQGWPVSQINDYQALYICWNVNRQANWASHTAFTGPAGIPLIGYEGGWDYVVTQLVHTLYLTEDMLSHPSFYDSVWRYFVWCQLGDYDTGGLVKLNYFNIWSSGTTAPGGIPLWKLSEGPGQITGRGLNNQFYLPQGGVNAGSGSGAVYSGYAPVNQAVGVQAMIDWNALTQVTPVAAIVPAGVLVGL